MDQKTILEALEQLAEKIGLEIRYERLGDDELDVRSGRCRLKGRDVLIVDRRLETAGRIEVLRRELQRMDLSAVFLKPFLRDFLSP